MVMLTGLASALLLLLAPSMLAVKQEAAPSGKVSALEAIINRHLLVRREADGKPKGKKTIPRIVFFTGPYDPEEVVKHNRAKVPHGTEFRYYNDAQMDASVRNISRHLEQAAGIKGAYKAFQNLRAEAFKADLWRAMIIWENGGLYIDAKDVMVSQLDDWLPPDEDSLVLCYDRYGGFYDNQIVAAPPRDPKLQVILRHIVNNLRHHSYGNTTLVQKNATGSKLDSTWTRCLAITGPVAYTAALREAGLEPHLRCLSDHVGGRLEGFTYDRAHYKNASTHEMVVVDSADVHKRMGAGLGGKGAKTGYYQLWATHGVYCDEPYPHDAGACAAQHLGGNMVEIDVESASHMAPYWSKIV